MKKILLLCVALAIASVAAFADDGTGPAGTDPPMVENAGWYGFCFGGTTGDPATPGCQNEGVGVTGNDITFTLADNAYFRVTDAFETGDSFDVYINGPLAFSTPSVAKSATCAEADCANPDQAFASSDFSHGEILLGPGTYT